MTTREPKCAPTLRARGWTYNPDADQPCGAVGERADATGFCERNAKWSFPGIGALCGQHALTARSATGRGG